jgi:hypothetical protein
MARFDINQYIAAKAGSFSSSSDFAKWAVENRVIDTNKVRYQAIREYYHALAHRDRREAKVVTAEHFSLSYDRIEEILYRKNL